MEFIQKTVSTKGRMYCPSTDEIIFAPDLQNIHNKADAFIGCWPSISMDRPSIKDQELKDAWKRHFEKNIDKNNPTWQAYYQEFFRQYENPEWVASECEFRGDPSLPFIFSDIYVVKADNILEQDPKQRTT